VNLDRESFARIVDWLDMNAVYYGDCSWNKAEWRGAVARGGTGAARITSVRGLGRRWPGSRFAALVNVALPEESRILKAPLAAEGAAGA